jgi:hypothetical protein
MPDRRRRTTSPPWNSLVAAAKVMTSPDMRVRKASIGTPEKWQHDAWRFFDEVGELRFGVQWIANALSRVNLVAGMTPITSGDEPTTIDWEDERATPLQRRAVEIVDTIAGGSTGQGQMLASFGTHLSVSGLAWLVIEPDLDDPDDDAFQSWNIYSSSEVRAGHGDQIEIRVSQRDWREVHPNGVVVKVWRRHPQRSWDADSPTHGVLGVLREIVMLQQHIQASAQSRLAGAGLLAIPSEAVFPPGQSPQTSRTSDPNHENVQPDDDQFVETLIDAMVTPLEDRGSAAAVVPLVIKVPGEFVDKITHISFATPFDDRVIDLLDQAIKRLALGLDIPPEILTGTGAMNHWGAWQVQEESITLHIEPLSEMICHALTIGYLRPALMAEGWDRDEIEELMVWYDTSDLRTRPDRSKSAMDAYDRYELSGEAMLREMGLSVDDMPTEDEKRTRILIDLVRALPSSASMILPELGLPSMPESEPVAIPAPSEAEPGDGPPERAAILAACDQVMQRAMERAGSRLKSQAGKGVAGGAASISCSDPALLHCEINALAHSTTDDLLVGAFDRVPDIASRWNVDPEALERSLRRYGAHLLSSGQAHTWERLNHAVEV